MPWPVRKIMSGSFYSNINDLGIVIIYASSLHILNYGDINWHECKLHIITLEKQTKKDNMNNAEKTCLIKMMISCFWMTSLEQ